MAPGTTITSEFYFEKLNKLRSSIQNKRRRMLTQGVVLLHDNVQPHNAAGTNDLIKLFSWEIFDHPPYSPDLAPSDYHLFTKMKAWLATQRFHTNEELMDLIFVVPCIMLNSEINPARCNNCVYSSQWLYSTCFG